MRKKNCSGTVVAVCVSNRKGTSKQPVPRAYLRREWGIEGDAHSGDWHRQVSLLGIESIRKLGKILRRSGAKTVLPPLRPGDFAENLTTRGIKLYEIAVGTKLKVGEEVLLEVTQIGKECHEGCEIRKLVGDCIMPREGIFARVVKGGPVEANAPIEIVER